MSRNVITPEHVEKACTMMAEGISLRAAAKDMGLNEASIRYHLMKDEQAFTQTAHARELGCDAMADQCLEIADDKELDPADRRIRIETRIKLIGKWSQRYSDKLTVNTNKTVVHRYELDSLSADELDTLERLADKASHAGGDTVGPGAPEPSAVH